jgi:hypothetical protein
MPALTDDQAAELDLLEAADNADDESARRISDLRLARGDATTDIHLRVHLTVRVRGELMSDEELAAILEPYSRGMSRTLDREVQRWLRLDAQWSRTLGRTPDDARQAYLDELVSVLVVEEIGR